MNKKFLSSLLGVLTEVVFAGALILIGFLISLM